MYKTIFAGLNTLTNQMSMLGARNRDDDLSPRVEDEEDQMYNKSRSFDDTCKVGHLYNELIGQVKVTFNPVNCLACRVQTSGDALVV